MDKMICHLQMDMVGRNEESDTEPASENEDTIHLVGSRRLSSELHAIVLSMNKYVNFRFEYDEEDVFGRSDHVNFHNKGVPVAFLFDGFHPDYHQPTDTVDKIQFRKIASAARLFYLVGFEAAQREVAFKKDAGGSTSNQKAA
jgi:Zn-dependent M28 family amino/carboxypeptidase